MNQSAALNLKNQVEFTDIYTDPEINLIPGVSDASWRLMGTLKSLYVRQNRLSTPRRVQSIVTIARIGIDGDMHCSSKSPRQILIAGTHAYERWKLLENSLRENLLFDFSINNLNSGDVIRIGSEVMLWITFVCEPCNKLYKRSPQLRTIVGTERGILARVITEGIIKEGDPVFLLPSMICSISNKWQDRVEHVMTSLPPNVSISYSQLAELAGVSTSYCRAFPNVLARLPYAVSLRALASKNQKTSFDF